jgi:hypothetical protein
LWVKLLKIFQHGQTPLDLAKKKIAEKKDEGLTEAAEPLYRTVALLESAQKVNAVKGADSGIFGTGVLPLILI